MSRDSLLSWFPVALRYAGLAGVIFVAVVWLLTNRLEPALLGLFGSMLGLGEGVDALKELSRSRSQPPPPVPPASPTGERA